MLSPKILIVSDSSLTPVQGTGACLLRHLQGVQPENIFSLHIENTGSEECSYSSYRVKSDLQVDLFTKLLRVAGRYIQAKKRFKRYQKAIVSDVESCIQTFQPDLIYCVPYSEFGLAVALVAKALLPEKKVIIHLFDWMPKFSPKLAQDMLTELSCGGNELWALGTNLAKDATRWTGLTYQVVPIFYDHIPPVHGKQFSETFSGCIVGNVWCKPAMDIAVKAWRDLQRYNKEIPALRWFASEWTIKMGWTDFLQSPENKGVIEHAGFFKGEKLRKEIQKASISLIPFSTVETESSHYAKYSIPSKITDLSVFGVPFVAVTSIRSGLGAFLRESGMGIQSDDSEACLVGILKELVDDPEKLHEAAEINFEYAKTHFDLGSYQKWFSKKTESLVGMSPS